MTLPEPVRIVYLTAGAGGMYCGSCMHDNMLARALTEIGIDVQLVPTYTPLMTDEKNVSIDQLFFGGLNVYLRQRLGRWGELPRPFSRWLDSPRLVRWMTGRSISIDPRRLGALTLSMLQGREGKHRSEVDRLVAWLRDHARPNLILLSNLLIGGSLPAIREAIDAPVFVILQGDDLFLDSLLEPYRTRAINQMQVLAKSVDRFLVHSQTYAQRMATLLDVPISLFLQVPLGIDSEPFAPEDRSTSGPRPPTIGYLARIAPEKGLALLVDAFIELRQKPGLHDTMLRVAGWMASDQRAFLSAQRAKLVRAGCDDAMQYVGSVDRKGKVDFLSSIDLLSVPTTYPDPKGLFVLESLAAGVPVVQPDHGAFPELVAATGGGVLVPPNDVSRLADALAQLLLDTPTRQQLGHAGQEAVRDRFHPEAVAKATWNVLRPFVEQSMKKL